MSLSKNKVFFVLAFILFAASPIFSQSSYLKKKSQLESKKKKLSREIRELNSMLNSTATDKKNSLGNLNSLNLKLEKRTQLINTINAEVSFLNKKIELTFTEIEILKNNLTKLKNEYSRMIQAAQRQQDVYNRLIFIFSSNSFNQAVMRLKYIEQYSSFRKKQAEEIVATQNILSIKLEELKADKDEKLSLINHESKQRDSLSVEKGQQEKILAGIQAKESDLRKNLERKKNESYALQKAIKKLIAAEIKRKAEEAAKLAAAKKAAEDKANASKTKTTKTKSSPNYPELSNEAVALGKDFAGNRGKLPWPITKGIVCEPYGEHEHPAIKGFMMVNNGIEICSTKGAIARAVFDGEVTSVAISPTGGKLVIIRHGEYLSVYTNLGDVKVKAGQKISIKETIGTVLNDDDDTKSSLNFQIWKGQSTMDPAGWLYKG
ncbi:MAG: peptidoglycan DD-metalloendopeptidase family protein [Flavobacteriales bacterium]|nr:peptidoglycan DD-metalloendopeptidase family protein [Flavobacteriales bacterium]